MPRYPRITDYTPHAEGGIPVTYLFYTWKFGLLSFTTGFARTFFKSKSYCNSEKENEFAYYLFGLYPLLSFLIGSILNAQPAVSTMSTDMCGLYEHTHMCIYVLNVYICIYVYIDIRVHFF